MSAVDMVVTPAAGSHEARDRSAPRSLAELSVGATATVKRLRCERSVSRRLMELGLLPGTPVTLRRVAPLGDPIELRLRGFSLSIRRAEAACIDVEPQAPQPNPS